MRHDADGPTPKEMDEAVEVSRSGNVLSVELRVGDVVEVAGEIVEVAGPSVLLSDPLTRELRVVPVGSAAR